MGSKGNGQEMMIFRCSVLYLWVWYPHTQPTVGQYLRKKVHLPLTYTDVFLSLFSEQHSITLHTEHVQCDRYLYVI